MKKENFFENRYLEFTIKDNLLYVKYEDGAIIDMEAAKIILKDRLEFQRGENYATFADVKSAKYWTKDAREFQSSEYNNEGIKALAMILSSHAQKIVVKFYLFFNKPNIPTNGFLDEKEALSWLLQYK